jgi:hypothetical protein
MPTPSLSKTSRQEPLELKPPRRFAPVPIETSTRTSRKAANSGDESKPTNRPQKQSEMAAQKPPRKFNPEPIEVSSRSSRPAGKNARVATSSTGESTQPPKKQPRKFAPQLIETARRTRKSGDDLPAVLPSDKTEATRTQAKQRPRVTPVPENTPTVSRNRVPQLPDPGSSHGLARGSSHHSHRHHQHSYRLPELDPIESSESDDSTPPSLSTSQTPSSDSNHNYYHATRIRESIDDRFSGFFLRLAAEEAEKQILRDQAMAVFSNNEFHEPVDHFINDDIDDEEEPEQDATVAESYDVCRSGSVFKSVNWNLKEMKEHHDRPAPSPKLAPSTKPAAPPNDGRITLGRMPGANAGWSKPPQISKFDQGAKGGPRALGGPNQKPLPPGPQADRELKAMRDSARPPMLGGSIVFPRCSSPDNAHFDVTQGSQRAGGAGSYLLAASRAPSGESEGLWHDKRSKQHSTRSNASSNGLWGGFCVREEEPEPIVQAGLMTPRVEVENPFESLNGLTPSHSPQDTNNHLLPPSPPASSSEATASIDSKLKAAKSFEDEFSDSFITQVYNYLSLGYPSLARKFDPELSKISRISVEELREDDKLAQSRGYIRLGDAENAHELGIQENMCKRWKALKAYIHEWARQQPAWQGVGDERALGGFGVGPRRGSWAW